jgi:peptide/nickel transport system ATP-binding protein
VFADPRHPYTKRPARVPPRLDTPYRLLPTVSDFLESREEGGEVVVVEKVPSAERLAELRDGGRAKMPVGTGTPLLSVRDLKVHFPRRGGWFEKKEPIKAVDGVSFDVYTGQTLGLVGESGCGKTTTGRAILRLVAPTAGQVLFDGKDLGALPEKALRATRRDLQIVFQDPYSSLNPRLTVEQAITEPMLVHGIGSSDADRKKRAGESARGVRVATQRTCGGTPTSSRAGSGSACASRAPSSLQPEFVVCDESVSGARRQSCRRRC